MDAVVSGGAANLGGSVFCGGTGLPWLGFLGSIARYSLNKPGTRGDARGDSYPG